MEKKSRRGDGCEEGQRVPNRSRTDCRKTDLFDTCQTGPVNKLHREVVLVLKKAGASQTGPAPTAVNGLGLLRAEPAPYTNSTSEVLMRVSRYVPIRSRTDSTDKRS